MSVLHTIFRVYIHVDEARFNTLIRIAPMINGFVALGMLKLDEPKTLQHKICDALTGIKTDQSGWVDELTMALWEHGLKIVEK